MTTGTVIKTTKETNNIPSTYSSGGHNPNVPQFGEYVFTDAIMEKMLPSEAFQNIIKARRGEEELKKEYADVIAIAIRDWAISFGATHYCHWFLPLTGGTAEKHDAFTDWVAPDVGIEKFSGKSILQGEPDASSFPSGGLRTTYEARGYTGWDLSCHIFLWEAGDGMTLCVPSVFFSWTGEVLDTKIPLLRSDRKIKDSCLRLLKLTGTKASAVYSTLGWEQEYFVIDRNLSNLRPDLTIAGRTVFGVAPAKGQELQDHYFGTVKDRILSYMQDFEDAALRLGIPVKTRHNEVAPLQHEVAPVYEKASRAVDHNIMLMELMRRIAAEHDLKCLFHEKPFANLNGSGKHNNWSLSTDTGLNLLNPTDSPENSIQFIILLTAIINAVHRHAELLRASIASAGNDHRLGGHEAPPSIISIFLGDELEALLESIENNHSSFASKDVETYNLNLTALTKLSKDTTDRNRTSPFAFTGQKFEYRAVGSSANCALPITILNTIVAESLNEILDDIEAALENNLSPTKEVLMQASLPVVRDYLLASKNVRFCGDNYSKEWEREARRRKLPNLKNSFHAFAALTNDKTTKVFDGILTKEELQSQYEIKIEQYALHINIEALLMEDLFSTRILPAALKHQRKFADSVKIASDIIHNNQSFRSQKKLLDQLVTIIGRSIDTMEELAYKRAEAMKYEGKKRAKLFSNEVLPLMEKARKEVDLLETMVDDEYWTLPKYQELLYLI